MSLLIFYGGKFNPYQIQRWCSFKCEKVRYFVILSFALYACVEIKSIRLWYWRLEGLSSYICRICVP